MLWGVFCCNLKIVPIQKNNLKTVVCVCFLPKFHEASTFSFVKKTKKGVQTDRAIEVDQHEKYRFIS